MKTRIPILLFAAAAAYAASCLPGAAFRAVLTIDGRSAAPSRADARRAMLAPSVRIGVSFAEFICGRMQTDAELAALAEKWWKTYNDVKGGSNNSFAARPDRAAAVFAREVTSEPWYFIFDNRRKK